MKNTVFTGARILLKPSFLLLLTAFALATFHLRQSPQLLSELKAETLYDYSVKMTFDAQDSDLFVETFLPRTDNRQEIIRESVRSAELQFDDRSDGDGRLGFWSGSQSSDIKYKAIVALQPVSYDLDPSLTIPESRPETQIYLQATEGIQVEHEEIAQLWTKIAPARVNQLLPVLESIHAYIYEEMGSAPFTGYTDAITALRLQQASCNGKGRLFVALARKNGIPARLVGGIILENGSKRTSHQWVEVLVQDHWVPFDPTNGHFAQLPSNYLKLYTGDKALFTHTPNINFNYLFTIDQQQTSSALFRFEQTEQGFRSLNAAELMKLTGLNEKLVGVFLMFPFAALITVFLRNVIGLKTFGIFMPMLVAAACIQTGLLTGLMVFGGVVAFAFAGELWLGRLNLLKIPRLAAIITLVTILFIALLFYAGQETSFEFGVLALFPVVIISFLAERIHKMASDKDYLGIFKSGLGTLVTIACCYAGFSSVTLQGLFALLPELLLVVLALQITVGQWTGMRLQEYFRFRKILHKGPVLGINQRNLELVSALNTSELLNIASDKIETKQLLRQAGVPVAKDLATCRRHDEIDHLIHIIDGQTAFAIKPNKGSQGNGILIIVGCDGDKFVKSNGDKISAGEISKHACEILAGSYSQDGTEDAVLVEPLLKQHPKLNQLADFGLSDIRIILKEHELIAAMLRLPTSLSDGKANLHQGAIGLSIDLRSGLVTHASQKGKSVRQHPDSGADLIGFKVPYWDQILEIAKASSRAVPLGYIGVDICIDAELGPLVLELNGRPGIEIQNVQDRGLFPAIQERELSYA